MGLARAQLSGACEHICRTRRTKESLRLMPTPETTAAVRVIAPARLHLGCLGLDGGLGRKFGSIGLAVDQPCTDLTLRRAAALAAAGEEQERTKLLVSRFAKHFGLPDQFAI